MIPKANPWVHFGNGKNTIDMQLSPGEHKLSVQAGDDKHATMAGLCETITVNVTGERVTALGFTVYGSLGSSTRTVAERPRATD